MSKKIPPVSSPLSSSVKRKKDSALDALLARASCDHLVAPVPKKAQLARILSAGLRAPDHGKIRPWRYVVISGKARADFAQKVMEAAARQEPDVPQKKQEKRRHRFATTPAIIALGMALVPDHKIPLWEQKMTIGAGAMNILNALFLEGFGGVWISGKFCQDPLLAETLGLKDPEEARGKKKLSKKKSGKRDGLADPDYLAGFLLIGTPESKQKPRKRPDIASYIAHWEPETPVSFESRKKK